MWTMAHLCDYIDINPQETLLKGTVAKKVSMDKLQPFCRDIPEWEIAEFFGGSKFRNGDTIMARITPCLENGKTALVNILDQNEVGFGSTEFIVFRAKESLTVPEYVYYLVKSSIIREPAIKSMVGSSGRQRVQTDVIKNIKIMFPDCTNQIKIAGVLSSIDDKIAINNQINKNLQQQAAAIYKSWFVNYAPFGGIAPKEWDEAKLEELTTLVSRGITPKYSDTSDQKVINQKCIRNHMIDISLARTHIPKAINEKWLRFGDLLINSTGEGTLGRAAQVWFQPQNLTVDSHVTIVRPAKENLIFYIGLWGTLHEKEIESLHTGSTGQTELPRDRIKMMELLLPDNETLDRFNAVIAPMATAIVSNQRENQKLAVLRDTLFPKLISGELDVSTLDL